MKHRTNPRSLASFAAVIGTVAIGAGAMAPNVAAAGDLPFKCAGVVIHATAHYQTLHGTACDDTFHIGTFAGVTVKAGKGNDTVRAGFNYGADRWLYMGDGNDTVLNPNDVKVWVDAGAGNDFVDGSSGYDAIYGGTGTDSATVTVGDFYDSIEDYV